MFLSLVNNPFDRGTPTSVQIGAFIKQLKNNKDYTNFSQTKLTSQTAAEALIHKATPGPVSIVNSVTLADNTTKVKLDAAQEASINTALSTSQATRDRIKDYQDTIGAVNHLITQAKAGKNEFSPQDFAGELNRQQTSLIKALDKQHTEEKNNLTALFSDQTFVDGLKKSNPGADVDAIKAKMLEALEKSQNEQKAAINKVIEQEKTAMHKAEQTQRELDFFIAFVAAKNAKNLERFSKLSQLEENTLISAKSKSPELIGKLKMQQITGFETASGKHVKADQGTFTLKSSQYGFAITQSDADAVALAVRTKLVTEGVNPDPNAKDDKFAITMKVSHDDLAKAKSLADKAYLACRRAGFPPGKITIEVNGKKDETYSKKDANDGVKPYIQSQNAPREKTTEMRNAVNATRDELNAAEALKAAKAGSGPAATAPTTGNP